MADLLRSPFLKLGVVDMPESGWVRTSTTWDDQNEAATFFRLVPVLNRAVTIRCNSIAALPFDIVRVRDGEIVDSSEDYQNITGWWDSPGDTLSQVEAALCVWNTAYLLNEGRALPVLRYLYPPSIVPDIDKETGQIKKFDRAVDGRMIPLRPEQVVHFWQFDPWIEAGPPKHSPVQAALAACGVLHNLDLFAAAFWARGAIKATILTVPQGTAKEEKDRLKTWWQTVLAGIKNAFNAHVLNADAVTATVIGEGVKELENTGLSDKEQRNVATAMGMPYTLLFSDAASYATAEIDQRQLYQHTVIPDALFIVRVLNARVLKPLGLSLRLAPERLEVFQEDETQRAGALAQLTTALADPASEVALQVLGYDLSDEQWELLRGLWTKKNSAPVPPALAPFTGMPQEEIDARNEAAEAEDTGEDVGAELRAWQKKAIARIKAGRPVNFTAEHIPPNLAGAIAGALEEAGNTADVKAIFENVWQNYP